jgi:hypothetical protein
MPRKRTQSVKETAAYRYCRYCKANRDKRRFDKHQAACKLIWQQAQQQLQLSAEPIADLELKRVDNFQIEVNFRFAAYTTTATITRNILKGSPSRVDDDGDVRIPSPSSFQFEEEAEEATAAACKTHEGCNYPLVLYQVYLQVLTCN